MSHIPNRKTKTNVTIVIVIVIQTSSVYLQSVVVSHNISSGQLVYFRHNFRCVRLGSTCLFTVQRTKVDDHCLSTHFCYMVCYTTIENDVRYRIKRK